MTQFRRSDPQQRSSVSAVEEILSAAAAKSLGRIPTRNGRTLVDRAVWFCACVTFEEAPTWLIYDTSDGQVGWCRMPDGVDIPDLVEAPTVTGSHVEPAEVLTWLQNPNSAPVPGDGSADEAVVREMGRKILDLQSD